MRMRSWRGSGWLLALGLVGMVGCTSELRYVSQVAAGQFEILRKMQPIDEVLASGKLTEEQARKLRLIVDVREFARNELGLKVGENYKFFHDTAGEPLSYNLSACRKDHFEAKQWRFPIIGTIDYLGYFERDQADAAEKALQDEGWDTLLGTVDAYSTLGYFTDPVHSPMLNRPDWNLVDTVIHELAHNTVYAPNQSNFNETLATFIGREGARRYLARLGDAGAAQIASAEAYYADSAAVTTWYDALYAGLRDYYARTDLTADEKIAGRGEIFASYAAKFASEVQPTLQVPARYDYLRAIPVNNAWILLNRRYNYDLSVMQDVYDAGGQDFGALLDRLRTAAKANDPWAALRDAAATARRARE